MYDLIYQSVIIETTEPPVTTPKSRVTTPEPPVTTTEPPPPCQVGQSCNGCGFNQTDQGCFYVEKFEAMTWTAAKALCEGYGANVTLATLDTQEVGTFMLY